MLVYKKRVSPEALFLFSKTFRGFKNTIAVFVSLVNEKVVIVFLPDKEKKYLEKKPQLRNNNDD